MHYRYQFELRSLSNNLFSVLASDSDRLLAIASSSASYLSIFSSSFLPLSAILTSTRPVPPCGRSATFSSTARKRCRSITASQSAVTTCRKRAPVPIWSSATRWRTAWSTSARGFRRVSISIPSRRVSAFSGASA